MQSRYGCHNRRDYRPRYFVQDGWWHDGWARTAKLAQVVGDVRGAAETELLVFEHHDRNWCFG